MLHWIENKIPTWLWVYYNRLRVYFGYPRKLRGNWTILDSESIVQHGIDVEDELAKILTEEINKEIVENGGMSWEEFCKQDKK